MAGHASYSHTKTEWADAIALIAAELMRPQGHPLFGWLRHARVDLLARQVEWYEAQKETNRGNN